MRPVVSILIQLLLLSDLIYGMCEEGIVLNYTHGEYSPLCTSTGWNILQCGLEQQWCWCVQDDGSEINNTMTKKSDGIPQCARVSDHEEAALSAAIVYLIVFLMLLVALVVTVVCILCKVKAARITHASETLVGDDVEMDEERNQNGDSMTDPPQPFLPPPPPTPPIPKNQNSFKPLEIDPLPSPIFSIPPPR